MLLPLSVRAYTYVCMYVCITTFVNSTTELGLSQMRVKGLEAVCRRSLQLFREGPVVPEAEELQRRIQAASTEER